MAARNLTVALSRALVVPWSPALPIGALTVLVWLAWSWRDASLSATRWGSFGTGLVLLLALGAVVLPVRTGSWSPARWLMLGSLAAFVVWNYLSMTWADFPADAWTGSDKALLYAASFCAFALWPWDDRGRSFILGLFVVGVGLMGAASLARAAVSEAPTTFLQEGRFAAPIGYVNGTAALWMLALWPSLSLAMRRDMPALLRSLFLGIAVLLVELAVLAQSRGWLFLLPVVLVLFVLLARQRLRALLALAIVAVGACAVVPWLLAVYERYEQARPIEPALDRAAVLVLVSSLLVALAGACWAILDRRIEVRASVGRGLGLALTVIGTVAVIVGLVVAFAAVAHPRAWVSDRWQDFTRGYTVGAEGSRFTGSLGTDRYQHWKVAVLEFKEHPAIGIGSDNYAAPYLLRREDNLHEPAYPHSTPLRLLSQLGLVGTALFALFAGIAAYFGLVHRRRATPPAGGMFAAALMVFAYWLLHGSLDVLWEMPGLAAPAFGLLGLACANEAATLVEASGPMPSRARSRWLAWGTGGLVVGAACVALILPWLSHSYARSGAATWESSPGRASERLDRAADLNPLSAAPLLLEGSLALRQGDIDTSQRSLLRALEREPKNWFVHLQLALAYASAGDYEEAMSRVRAARELNPRDPVIQIVQELIRTGSTIDIGLIDELYERRLNRQSVAYLIDNFFPNTAFTLSDP